MQQESFVHFFPPRPSPSLFPSVPWLPASTTKPFHCIWFLLPRACSCLGPAVPVPYSHLRPEPSDLSPETAVPPPPLQPTANAATAAVAAQSRRCRALPVRAQYTATPSRALSTLSPVLPIRLNRRHGPYSRWFSLQAQGQIQYLREGGARHFWSCLCPSSGPTCSYPAYIGPSSHT